MAEWSNALVLKTSVPQGTGGSNPSLSAQTPENQRKTLVFFYAHTRTKLASVSGMGIKNTERRRRTGFHVFLGRFPSRDLLSEAKKIPATEATGIKSIPCYYLSNKKIYRYKNNSYNLNFGLV